MDGVMAQRIEQIFAVTAPGLEAVCAAELQQVLGVACRAELGGVAFAGAPRELYLANLWSRCASRILVRVGDFPARDFPGLYRKALQLPWGRYVRPGTALEVRATSRSSRLVHTGRLAETVSEAVRKSLGDGSADTGVPEQLIVVRVDNDHCQISIDSSGELLHRRGFRAAGAQAPLRETLAAGILQLLGWNGDEPLVDPMCGSGTFLVEAAMLAARQAPGAGRDFAFMHWPHFRAGAWNQLLDAAIRGVVPPQVALVGSDLNPEAVAAARTHAQQAGVAEAIRIDCVDFAALVPPAGPGLVLCNPPYGLRVGRGDDLVALYTRLGQSWRQQFSGWRAALFCPDAELVRATGLALQPLADLRNGGLAVTLFAGRIRGA